MNYLLQIKFLASEDTRKLGLQMKAEIGVTTDKRKFYGSIE